MLDILGTGHERTPQAFFTKAAQHVRKIITPPTSVLSAKALLEAAERVPDWDVVRTPDIFDKAVWQGKNPATFISMGNIGGEDELLAMRVERETEIHIKWNLSAIHEVIRHGDLRICFVYNAVAHGVEATDLLSNCWSIYDQHRVEEALLKNVLTSQVIHLFVSREILRFYCQGEATFFYLPWYDGISLAGIETAASPTLITRQQAA